MAESATRIVLLSLIMALIVGGLYWYGYSQGYAASSAAVQAHWEQEAKAEAQHHAELVQKLTTDLAVQVQKQEQVAHELAQLRQAHAAVLSARKSAHRQRLLQSARRAEVYRDQAEAGAASCGSLASHAAQLDRALEEGRGLVDELRETLGLRDRQVRLLGQQIENDRQFFEGGAGSAP